MAPPATGWEMRFPIKMFLLEHQVHLWALYQAKKMRRQSKASQQFFLCLSCLAPRPWLAFMLRRFCKAQRRENNTECCSLCPTHRPRCHTSHRKSLKRGLCEQVPEHPGKAPAFCCQELSWKPTVPPPCSTEDKCAYIQHISPSTHNHSEAWHLPL